MKIELETLWPGHRILWIRVKKWRRWYRWFNRCFARANYPIEISIVEREE